MKFRFVAQILTLCAISFVASSCIESNAIYTLNPDGSGKVTHEVKLTKTMGNWTDDNPDKELAMNLIRGSEGIVAWDDVEFRMTDAGNAVEFRGIGYFPDISKVDLGRAISKTGENHHIPIPLVNWNPDAEGKGLLTLKDSDGLKNSSKMEVKINSKTIKKKKTSDEEEDDSGLGGLMQMKLAMDSTYRVQINVAGTLSNPKGFDLDDSKQKAKFSHAPPKKSDAKAGEAARIKKALEEKGGKKAIVDGGVVENEALQKILFERDVPFTLEVNAQQPSFDYESEVEEADLKVAEGETKKQLEGWKKLKSLE